MALVVCERVLAWLDRLLVAKLSTEGELCIGTTRGKCLQIRLLSRLESGELNDSSPVIEFEPICTGGIDCFELVDVLGIRTPTVVLSESARSSSQCESWTIQYEVVCVDVKNRCVDRAFTCQLDLQSGCSPSLAWSSSWLVDGPSLFLWNGDRLSAAFTGENSNERCICAVADDLAGCSPVLCARRPSGEVDVWVSDDRVVQCVTFEPVAASCWTYPSKSGRVPIPQMYVPVLSCVKPVLDGHCRHAACSVAKKVAGHIGLSEGIGQDMPPIVLLIATTFGQVLLVVNGLVGWVWDAGMIVSDLAWIMHRGRMLLAATSATGVCKAVWLGEIDTVHEWKDVFCALAVDLLSRGSQQLLVLSNTWPLNFALTDGVETWGKYEELDSSLCSLEDEEDLSSLQSTVRALQYQCQESRRHLSHTKLQSQHKAGIIEKSVELLHARKHVVLPGEACSKPDLVPLLEGDVGENREEMDQDVPCPLEVKLLELSAEKDCLHVEIVNVSNQAVFHPTIALVPLFSSMSEASVAVNFPPSFQNCVSGGDGGAIACLLAQQKRKVAVHLPSYCRAKRSHYNVTLHWMTKSAGVCPWNMFSRTVLSAVFPPDWTSLSVRRRKPQVADTWKLPEIVFHLWAFVICKSSSPFNP